MVVLIFYSVLKKMLQFKFSFPNRLDLKLPRLLV